VDEGAVVEEVVVVVVKEASGVVLSTDTLRRAKRKPIHILTPGPVLIPLVSI
jgi:hypothetical protein